MTERDLKRAEAAKAKACVLLTNKYDSNSYAADYKIILTAIAIKKFVYYQTEGQYNINLCMQLIKPESKTFYYNSVGI